MKKGFTLIELLIVVAIIGILAAIAVPNFLNAQVRAKVARVFGDLRALRTALDMYIIDHGRSIPDPGEVSYTGQVTMWWPLTTPTAYINGSATKDPFIPIDSPTQNSAWEAVMFGDYQYRHIKWMREANNQAAQQVADPTAIYVARSAGPDRWYINSPHRLASWMVYDSSNGVVSVGDILMSDKGLLGESHKGQDSSVGNI